MSHPSSSSFSSLTPQTLPRLPNPRYIEHKANGFVDFDDTPFTDTTELGGEDVHGPHLDKALDQWRYAQFVLKWKGRPVPDFETMKAEVEKTITGEDVKKKIAELEQDHIQDLERLYDMQAKEYIRELEDVYLSRDDGEYKKRDGEEQTGEQKNLETFLNGSMRQQLMMQRLLSDHSHLRYNHLHRVNELLYDEKERMKKFPADIDDFKSRPKDVQVRVARYLVADRQRQERYLNEFGWVWRQTQPLVECFKKDF
ncbi:hypothetical protein BJ165DRAFT_426223 [Panaeolus papilionaceus]|nr:hypothetical protein BJ165DRAFT_426223 [Panaeolus papilionaceus]